jgi:hypothetical protein
MLYTYIKDTEISVVYCVPHVIILQQITATKILVSLNRTIIIIHQC